MHTGRTTTFVRVIGILSIALLSLASARSLVPGLCATQAALEQCDVRPTASCCEVPTQRSDDGAPIVEAVQGEVHCAFCNLATTMVTALNVVTFDTVLTPRAADIVHAETLAFSEAVDQTNSGRAPPVFAAA